MLQMMSNFVIRQIKLRLSWGIVIMLERMNNELSDE